MTQCGAKASKEASLCVSIPWNYLLCFLSIVNRHRGDKRVHHTQGEGGLRRSDRHARKRWVL
eukprot:6198734-Pleurochrysis_carterae.AAC.2